MIVHIDTSAVVLEVQSVGQVDDPHGWTSIRISVERGDCQQRLRSPEAGFTYSPYEHANVVEKDKHRIVEWRPLLTAGGVHGSGGFVHQLLCIEELELKLVARLQIRRWMC